ncbi:MAG TPA: hypothetical protein VN922_23845 [Bacteroidia bacterium]|nr:hypothetical protein [Bacteroidia bacterium]
MDNTKLPAYPTLIYNEATGNPQAQELGFTKLEKAALMIAQGMIQRQDKQYDPETTKGVEAISSVCVDVARAVLEEANKQPPNKIPKS